MKLSYPFCEPHRVRSYVIDRAADRMYCVEVDANDCVRSVRAHGGGDRWTEVRAHNVRIAVIKAARPARNQEGEPK